MQVGKGAFPTYRGQMAEYEVQYDIVVVYSKALENPQYGVGDLTNTLLRILELI